MRRGMKLQRRAVSAPLLPPALRRPAAVVVTGCAAVTASLALAFAGQARPDGLDRAVDAHVRRGLAPYQGKLHLLAELGDLVPVTVLTAALILACLATRRRRGPHSPVSRCPERWRSPSTCSSHSSGGPSTAPTSASPAATPPPR